VSAELHGVTLKDHNLNAEHLEQFHTHSFANTCTDKITLRQNCQRHCSVKFNKQ
jgi:hypothetical protein